MLDNGFLDTRAHDAVMHMKVVGMMTPDGDATLCICCKPIRPDMDIAIAAINNVTPTHTSPGDQRTLTAVRCCHSL